MRRLDHMSKDEIRLAMRRLRAGLAHGDLRWRGDEALDVLCHSPAWQQARALLAYWSMPEEMPTHELVERALSEGRRVYLPRCVPGESCFEAVELRDLEHDLAPGPFPGLMEPRPDLPPLDDPAHLDLILVPGVAFDTRGYRMGFGAGMYDRFLSRGGAAWRVGYAFSFQLVDALPAEAHDQTVDAVATEAGWVTTGEGGERLHRTAAKDLHPAAE